MNNWFIPPGQQFPPMMPPYYPGMYPPPQNASDVKQMFKIQKKFQKWMDTENKKKEEDKKKNEPKKEEKKSSWPFNTWQTAVIMTAFSPVIGAGVLMFMTLAAKLAMELLRTL